MVASDGTNAHMQCSRDGDTCLQVSAEALQQSGGAVRSTGTYIGCMFVDYMSLQREAYGMRSTGAVSPQPGLSSMPALAHKSVPVIDRALIILSCCRHISSTCQQRGRPDVF